MRRFGSRHHRAGRRLSGTTMTWSATGSPTSPSCRQDARLLVGAYFSHEYSVEAAALCNPSMVAHPDQSGLDTGQLRVAISLRQIGEGHLSSIGFATAVIGPGTRSRRRSVRPARRPASGSAPVTAATCSPPGSPRRTGTTRSPRPCSDRVAGGLRRRRFRARADATSRPTC